MTDIEELIKSFAIESARFHLETFGRQWGGQITLDHLPKQQREHLEQCKEVLRHYGMLEENLYKGNCKVVPEETVKNNPENNPWQENTGKQPVADDVRVDVRFFNESDMFANRRAAYWEWDLTTKSNCNIQFWRYAEEWQ